MFTSFECGACSTGMNIQNQYFRPSTRGNLDPDCSSTLLNSAVSGSHIQLEWTISKYNSNNFVHSDADFPRYALTYTPTSYALIRRFSWKRMQEGRKFPLIRHFSCKKNTKEQKMFIDSLLQLQQECDPPRSGGLY